MNILVLIQSFIPLEKENEYFPVLMDSVNSVRNQIPEKDWYMHIVLSDDGSDYLADAASNEIRILQADVLQEIQSSHHLDIDDVVLIARSETYGKAELFDYYLKQCGAKYDLIVYLDDDHPFIDNTALARFVKHARNGYGFIVGRLYHEACFSGSFFRSYYDNFVQGTTFATTFEAIRSVGFFGEDVKKWGCGEDSVIFWKLYVQYLKGNIKAMYDGNIITIDRISGRWLYCLNKAGGANVFKRDFYRRYGVNPTDNPSRNKPGWMTYQSDEKGMKESLFPYVKLDEYRNIVSGPSFYYRVLWLYRMIRAKLMQFLIKSVVLVRRHITLFLSKLTAEL